MRSLALVSVAVSILGLHAEAGAQDSFAGTVDRTTNQCVRLETSCTSDDGCISPDTTSECATFTIAGVEQRACRPTPSAFCCGDGIDCPDGSRCVFGAFGTDVGLCVQDSNDYCGSELPTLICHTSTAGDAPVGWEDGDCDGDGVRNGVEQAVGTDPCAAPPGAYGVIVGDGSGGAACLVGVAPCEEIDLPCELEGTTRARCVHDERTGSFAPLCSVPPDLFCCGGLADLSCPAGECVLPSDVDDFGVCTDASLLCPDRSEAALTQCHRGVDGRAPVRIEDGDCDGDGVANAREVDLGRDHCGPDVLPDGAMRDAGGPSDSLDVSFGGGGGCRCAAGARRSSPLGLALASMLGLAIALRRRP